MNTALVIVDMLRDFVDGRLADATAVASDPRRHMCGGQGRYSRSMYFLSRSRTIPRNGMVAARP